MASANKTINIGLNQWLGSDYVKMADFNADNLAIDAAMGNKVDKVTGKGLSTEDYTTAEKNKLSGISAGANNYSHPAAHPPSIITQDASNRFMTDAERAKLQGIADGATNYSHPASHPASMITEAVDKRFMTDAERAKLSGVAAGANNYSHPSTHDANMITTDSNRRFISDSERNAWNGMIKTGSATIGTTSWSPVSGLYRASIANGYIGVSSVVNVAISSATLNTAVDADMQPFTLSYAGGFYIYCKNVPVASITIDYVALKGA